MMKYWTIFLLLACTFAYFPFTREPTLFYSSNREIDQGLEGNRNDQDPSYMQLGPDGNFYIVFGANGSQQLNKISPDGEIIIQNKPIFQHIDGFINHQYVFDPDGNMHFFFMGYDPVPDTVITY